MDDLKLIKRHFGEQMMHLCRELFPTLLETPGLLYTVLSSTYAPSKCLYEDIISNKYVDIFKNLIYDKADLKKETENKNKSKKTSKELLEKAGYILYECHSEEDIQKFRKYYKPSEELCTFNGNRLERCHVFFAVKKNIDDIKRENYYVKEKRQDEYGTSVISIQFSRGKRNTLSIKNRYNHTVSNPDATFSNNLENIIPGLTEAFEQEYNLNINAVEVQEDLDGYVLANDGRYYKYNYEVENTYYCENNIVIDNFEVKEFDKSRYIVLDNFILDMQEKTIKSYEPDDIDSFLDGLQNIQSIELKNNKDAKTKDIIINKDIIITIDELNRIVKYKNHHLTETGEIFLWCNEVLKEIDIPNVTSIGNDFLTNNDLLESISLPNVVSIGTYFLCTNTFIKNIDLPNVKKIGADFFRSRIEIEEINLPSLEEVGYGFLMDAHNLKKVNLPKLRIVGSNFLDNASELRKIELPECEKIGEEFLYSNTILSEVILPKVRYIGSDFLGRNEILKEIVLPELKEVRGNFMYYNKVLNKISVPKLAKIEESFLYSNNKLREIDLPSVEEIDDGFLYGNISLEKITAPNLQIIYHEFLYSNKSLTNLDLPKLESIGNLYLCNNPSIFLHPNSISLPSLEYAGTSNDYITNLFKHIVEENYKKHIKSQKR